MQSGVIGGNGSDGGGAEMEGGASLHKQAGSGFMLISVKNPTWDRLMSRGD